MSITKGQSSVTSAEIILALGYVPENVAEKTTDVTLSGNSDILYPSEKAVKTYADTKQSALGFTPENIANKTTDGTLSGNSDILYPSEKAVKTYADTKQSSLGFTPENIANKATDFTTLNNTLYPTTQSVSTLVSSSLSTPGSKTFYVDKNRTDTYVQTGTMATPYKTIQAAINKAASNADGSITSIYKIDIIGSGMYVENLTLNDLGLVAISFEGHGDVTIQPAVGTDAINSTVNNTNLIYCEFTDMLFSRAVRFTNPTSGSNFLSNGIFFRTCFINIASQITGAVTVDMIDCRTSTWSILNTRNLTCVNVSFGGTCASITSSDPTPLGWTGLVQNTFRTCIYVQSFNDTGLTTTVNSNFSNCSVNGGAFVINGTCTLNGSIISSPTTISATGTLTQNGSFISSTITNNGTIVNNNGNIITNASFVSGNGLIANNAVNVSNNGHLKSTQTTPPTTTTNSNAGTGATSSVLNATDTAGNLSLTTGGVLTSSGIQTTVNFNKTYNVAPIVSIQETNSNSVLEKILRGIFITSTTSGFSINFSNVNLLSTNYNWSYQIIETQ